MITFPAKTTVYFDVDDTLVMHPEPGQPAEIQIAGLWVTPHARHIARLKEHSLKGNTVIVWSGGGSEWAAAVILALGLETYVNACISKPYYYYDDLADPRYFMGMRLYLEETRK